MDRPMKFRAWHPEKGWADEVTVYGDGSWSASFGVTEGYDEDDGMHLMQFTGLLDRDDNPIFEDDIVEYLNNTSHGLVKEITVIRDIRYLPDFSCSKWQVVIGNVWETPELVPNET